MKFDSHVFSDLSTLRLSKVRAGSNLTSVLKKPSSSMLDSFRSQNAPNLGIFLIEIPLNRIESDPTSRPQLVSQQTERPNTQTQLHVSKFMEQYLSQKGVNAGVLSEKENNIYGFFKVN